MGFGGAQGAGGSGGNGTVYIPRNQAGADTAYTDLITGLLPDAQSGGAAGQYYTAGQDFLDRYVTGTPNIDVARDASRDVFDAYRNDVYPTIAQSASNVYNNPYYSDALTGAKKAADIGTAGADALVDYAKPLVGYAKTGIDYANTGIGAARQTLDTAYDPQNKLYNRGRSTAADTANVKNAGAGLAGTPYGSSVSTTALNNYDIDWQDKQLKRQESGLTAYGDATKNYTGAVDSYGKAVGTYDTAMGDASKLAYTSSAYPSKTYLGQQSATLDAYKDWTQGLKDYSTFGAAPYNTDVGIGKNDLTGINDVVNLGDDRYKSTDNLLKYLQSYLGLGQSASTISGNLGETGLKELGSAASGIGSTANTLLGTGSSSGGLIGSTGSSGISYGGGGELGLAADTGSSYATGSGGSGLLGLLGDAAVS